MEKAKKHHVLIVIVLIVLIVGLFYISHDEKNYSYSVTDFGAPALLRADCSSLQNITTNSVVNVSFNAPNVSAMRDKIKVLITKYNGQITGDSFNSYPNYAPSTPAQDNAYIVVSFDKSPNEFLSELSSLIKNSGGIDSGYNFTDGSQPQSQSNNGAYSTYSSCVTAMQNVSVDLTQLEVFTNALKEERNTVKLSLLGQSIANAKNSLQTDVNNVNGFFTASDKPLVNITVNSLQK